jgi:hypothetical protein
MPGFQYRQRYRLELEGWPEPFEVATNARDTAALVIPISDDGRPEFPMGFVLEVVHNALTRQEVPGIPADLGAFMDLVIDVDEIGQANGVDPTRPVASDA